MTPELATSLFQGLALLLGALGISAGARVRRSAISRREWRHREKVILAWAAHAFRLEEMLSVRGIAVPKRPKILDPPDDDGDDSSAPARGRP